MEHSKALGVISNGHMIWSPEYANEVCDALGVDHIKPIKHKSDTTGAPKGLRMNEGFENTEGVDSLQLAYHVARKLGVTEFRSCIGRGFQAQAISGAVAEHFKNE